jgi:hypothetical protein
MTSAEAIEALADVIGEGVSCGTMSRSVRVRPDRYADSTLPALRPPPAGRRRRCLRSRARRPGRVRYQDQHHLLRQPDMAVEGNAKDHRPIGAPPL